MSYYLLRPCRGQVGYLSTLKKKMKINLGSVRQQLEELGYEVVDVKHMLIARREVEITIYPDARLLVREDDEVRAREIVEMMYGIIMQGNNQ